MKCKAVIQARLESARLPRKILSDIGGQPLIGHILNRLSKLKNKDFSIAFAVPENEVSAIRTELPNYVEIIGGDTYDVLSRYLQAAEGMDDDDYLIRITGDNPFPDMGTMETCLSHTKTGADYFYPLGLPLGMGYEFIKVKVLRSLQFRELAPHHLEHVTIFFRENPHLFEITPLGIGPFYDLESDKHYRPDIRLTIDEKVDLEFARKVFTHFEKTGNPHFGAREVASLYAHLPEFFADNLHVSQRSAQSHDKRGFQTTVNAQVNA